MSKRAIFSFAISTTLIVLFLFFIDEGYYNFNWMNDIGNWVAFLIYYSGIFITQLLFFKLLLPLFGLKNKITLSIVLGTASALTLIIYILMNR